ncbi:MAG: tetratricopeptide repeat protein [Flavihumibacter sp.]
MKKEQIIVIAAGCIALFGIYFWGNTKPPQQKPAAAAGDKPAGNFDIQTAIKAATAQLPANQQACVSRLNESVVRGDVKDQQLATYRQLAAFWSDSAHAFLPFAFYTAEAAKLENSKKSLTFAAQLLLNNLRGVDEPGIKSWLSGTSKTLFEQALVLDPDNDSLKIGMGSTYIFGAPADNPQELMQGIQQILAVSRKDSTNIYAQKMLGIGGIVSGQYDKAVERLEKVSQATPHDMEVLLMLAEGYERMGNKQKAADWYKKAADHVESAALKTELEKRIQQLQ